MAIRAILPASAILVVVFMCGCSLQRPRRPDMVMPTSPIRLTAQDAERVALQATTHDEPTFLPDTIQVSYLTTEAPGLVPGTPVYLVTLDGHIGGPFRPGHMVGLFVDATTGKLLNPKVPPPGPPAQGGGHSKIRWQRTKHF